MTSVVTTRSSCSTSTSAGPMRKTHFGGSKYLLLIVGRSQRMHEGVSALRAKSESEDCIKTYIMKVQKQFGKKVKFGAA
ncbi:hypothetical protein Pcac1_g29427 [Phytophthora cactorum]|nr:hypothetical protein Pcac1_g29427 [Phytophthora cactorum]